jgi:hypothetical protein
LRERPPGRMCPSATISCAKDSDLYINMLQHAGAWAG